MDINIVPISVCIRADELIEGGVAPVDAMVLAAIGRTNDYGDTDFGKAYGIAHWSELSADTRVEWVRAYGYAVPELVDATRRKALADARAARLSVMGRSSSPDAACEVLGALEAIQ